MEYPFIIPLSYKNLFERLGPDATRSLITNQMDFAHSYPQGTSRPIDDDLAVYFLKTCTSVTYLKHALSLLIPDDLKQLRRIVRRGAVNPARNTENSDALTSLSKKGLVFRLRVDKERMVSAPIEVCLAVPFDDGERVSSLLQSFNRYPQDVVRSLAYLRDEPGDGGHKIRMATALYVSTIRGYPGITASLPREELDLLRVVFKKGGRVWLSQLSSLTNQGQPQRTLRYNYDYANLFRFLNSARRGDQAQLSPESRMVLSLIVKGFFALFARDFYYGSDQELFIPTECLSYVGEVFFAEMDKTRASIEREMLVEEQRDVVSYGERIFDDARKMRVAAACGLIERRIDGEPKKASLTRIGRLINAEDAYVENLLRVFSAYIYHPLHEKRKSGPGHTSEPVLTLRDALVAAVQGNRVGRDILEVLLALSGWMRVNRLMAYLANHRVLHHLTTYLNEAQLAAEFARFHLCGILDMSPDGGAVRVSPHARRLLEEGETNPLAIIPENEKSLIVQGNLEILVPSNVHVSVLQSVSSFAALTVLDKMLHFTLTKGSLISAVEKGWGHKQVLSYLTQHVSTGVPQPVERFIQTMGARQGEALVAPAGALIRCSGLGVREKLLAMRELECYSLPGTEEYLCVLHGEPTQIERVLKKKGIFAEVKKIIS